MSGERNYWQVAAGDGERDYSEVFLKYGVMFIGPGDPGEYFEKKDYYDDKDRYKPNDVKYFAEQVKKGDIVVLKRPRSTSWEVVAVGTVKGGYTHLPAFDDVEGWDLQHCRCVEWKKSKDGKPVPTTGLTMGTFRRIGKDTQQTVYDLWESGVIKPPKRIPKPTTKLDDEDLIDDLISHGLRPKDAEEFTQTIQRIRQLVKWYHSCGKDVKEHETRTFLIIPLLLALGWSQESILRVQINCSSG